MTKKHRQALDLTYSAPMSASVLRGQLSSTAQARAEDFHALQRVVETAGAKLVLVGPGI